MFTKNWHWKVRVDNLLGFSDSNVRPTHHSYTGTMYNLSGVADLNLYASLSKLLGIAATSPMASGEYYGVAFGDGTAEPTEDDVMLSGTQHLGITASNTTIEKTMTVEGDERVISAVYTINNTTGADLTISEVGMFSYATFYISASSTSTGYRRYLPCLVERSLLENPITIPANGVGKVTYTIRRTWDA